MPAAGHSSRVRRAAVVVHPGKHADLDAFRAVVHKAMADLGWAEPLWLETSLEDPACGPVPTWSWPAAATEPSPPAWTASQAPGSRWACCPAVPETCSRATSACH